MKVTVRDPAFLVGAAAIIYLVICVAGSLAHAQQASNGDRGSVADRGAPDRGGSDHGPRRWPTDPTCGLLFCEPPIPPSDPGPEGCGAIPIPCDHSGPKDPLEWHKPNPPEPNQPHKPKPKPKPAPTPVPPVPEPYPGEGPTNKPHQGDEDL